MLKMGGILQNDICIGLRDKVKNGLNEECLLKYLKYRSQRPNLNKLEIKSWGLSKPNMNDFWSVVL